MGGATGQIGAPLAGIGAKLRAARHASLRSALVHQGRLLALVALVVAVLLIALARARRHGDIMLSTLILHAAALCGGSGIWLGYAGAARVFGGMYPLISLSWLRQRTALFGLLVGAMVLLTIFTIVRLVAITPVAPHCVTP
jgi:hypothetical protein